MTTEQLYLLAREFCARFNFATLAAAAAASTAKVEGIAIHDNHRDAARAMAEVLARVPALNGYNAEFAKFSARVYLSVKEVA